MYVCNCNGISERMVQTALNDGATTWTEVHQYFNFSPCCGKCSTEITDTIALKRRRISTIGSPEPVFKSAFLASEF
tara:strand:+ start:1893 stop:2120 length:228 start_codon:yes stop_codon:yes gene_type:complete